MRKWTVSFLNKKEKENKRKKIKIIETMKKHHIHISVRGAILMSMISYMSV